MPKYLVNVTRAGQLEIEAESPEALNELLRESDDDLFETINYTVTEWDILAQLGSNYHWEAVTKGEA